MNDLAHARRRLIQLALGLTLLLTAGCDRAEREATEAMPRAFQAVSGERPETPVVTATAPPQREIAPVRVDAGLPQTPGDRVRLTRDGLLIDRPLRFDADVVAVGPDSVALSGGYSLTHRLPEGHALSLEAGRRYVIDFLPTSVAGSDEISATVYEAVGEKARTGPVVMQAVQRGGGAPIRIVEETLVVEQIDDGEVIQDNESELTTEPTVRLTAGRGRWVLVPSEPVDFQAAGAQYRATLLRSLHFQPKPGPHSAEGPSYVLEYVITRLPR